jgi:MFS superfamily sulfate permease-like transporter
MWGRIKLFFTFWDSRYEDLNARTWKTALYRDFSAGLIVALTAIPMAMGFAMAMGLRPEQGIIAGAVACLVGRTFGGSKYQVYGPTAAFIPILAAAVAKYDHGFLVFVSVLSGVVLMLMGLAGLGKVVQRVPVSIVVGFTVGIGVTIAMTNLGEMFGYHTSLKGNLANKLQGLWEHRGEFNVSALAIALMTFLLIKGLLKVSIYIPAPLIALGVATLLGATMLADAGLVLVRTKYGEVPSNFFAFTPPTLPELNPVVMFDIAYFVVAIVFVSAVESLLCSSMADRLANNKKTPFHPDKEFWGQGLVQIITPLLNGFPCTGALARTATSIKAGAVTPFAGYFKGVLKIGLAVYLARYLDLVPMACIGGILLWVATNMIKWGEIKEVAATGWFPTLVMLFTAVMVPMTDFLTGVSAALVLHWALARFFVVPSPPAEEPVEAAAREQYIPERVGA